MDNLGVILAALAIVACVGFVIYRIRSNGGTGSSGGGRTPGSSDPRER